MKSMLTAACGVAACCLSTTAFAQGTAPAVAVPAAPLVVQQQATNMLPSNSDVWLSLDAELNSKKARVGDPINFKVSRDVMVGQFVVIPRGTPGVGRLTYRTGKGAFGKSAKMEFDIDSVQLPGRTIPVTGHYRVEGQGNTGAAVGAVVAVGVFGAFVTGHSAVAAQGSEWKAATKEPILIASAGGTN